jgi:hypothetical protein
LAIFLKKIANWKISVCSLNSGLKIVDVSLNFFLEDPIRIRVQVIADGLRIFQLETTNFANQKIGRYLVNTKLIEKLDLVWSG